MWHQIQGTSKQRSAPSKAASGPAGWGSKAAGFVRLWRNASHAQGQARSAVRDELAADELSRAKDGSMGWPPF
jgi:hypothetical protein